MFSKISKKLNKQSLSYCLCVALTQYQGMERRRERWGGGELNNKRRWRIQKKSAKAGRTDQARIFSIRFPAQRRLTRTKNAPPCFLRQARPTELGTCGYFKFWHIDECWIMLFLHLLLTELTGGGVGYFDRPGPEIGYFYYENSQEVATNFWNCTAEPQTPNAQLRRPRS